MPAVQTISSRFSVRPTRMFRLLNVLAFTTAIPRLYSTMETPSFGQSSATTIKSSKVTDSEYPNAHVKVV